MEIRSSHFLFSDPPLSSFVMCPSAMHTRPRMSAYILAIHTRRAVKTLLATQIIQCAEKKFGGGDCWRFRTTGRCVEFFSGGGAYRFQLAAVAVDSAASAIWFIFGKTKLQSRCYDFTIRAQLK